MKVVLGVTGCIGAYKSALIMRLLQRRGIDVYPVMTHGAQHFLAPLTLEKLSGHSVVTDLWQDNDRSIEHISLARATDLLLVAPATANILGKFAQGIADDFLSTLYLSTTTPVMIAPAMNVEMWHHPAVQSNLSTLRGRGVHIIEPESGYLACGEEGEGRLAEPESIVEAAVSLLEKPGRLADRKVLVTAGPTVEDLDAVRYISNRSSGKMGYAIAHEARLRGAQVVLITGPTQVSPPSGVEVIQVRSARQMADAVFSRFADVEVVVMAAAVSDYQPTEVGEGKIKKGVGLLEIVLAPTVDILRELGQRKSGQVLVGFAAESSDLREHALQKLREKRLDLIVANGIVGASSAFGSDFNEVLFLTGDQEERLPRLSKHEVAEKLWNRIESLMTRQPTP